METSERTNERGDRRTRLAAIMPVLRAFARRVTRSAELAEELVQETCMRVLGAGEIPDESARFGPWCREVARNVWIAQRRRMARTNEVSLESGVYRVPDVRFDPERSVYANERLARASSGLDGESAQLLVRRYLFGERAVDLAGEHAENPTAVRTRLWRLRSTLRGAKKRR